MSNHPKAMSKDTIIDEIAPLVWERQDPLPMPVLEICNYTFLQLNAWNHKKNFIRPNRSTGCFSGKCTDIPIFPTEKRISMPISGISATAPDWILPR